jgi:putative heme-binding domain-containing protein
MTTPNRLALPVLLLFLGLPAAGAAEGVPGLKVPPGFEVTEFADSTQANDIFCMTLDPKGRVLVSGRGYLRLLEDTDGDGKADRVSEFAAAPKDGAMGLLWEDTSLFVMGDGGLRRYHVPDGAVKPDGPPELVRAMKTGGEHDAHAIRRGPDGWLYVLCGNNTGIDKTFAQLPTSPVKDPVAGCVLRFSPDLKSSEIVADGYRNPYGMDFNGDGELFTFDSDNERCVSLPWYEGCRFYHVLPGGHSGWEVPQHGQFWRLPPYFADVVAPVLDLGRGSPTGVVFYRHTQFPEKYRGGVFLLDWTFGRVWFLSLKRSGASYTAQKELFLEATGDNGFAPTAAAVDPRTGDLHLSIGGRGTRGAVYKVRYVKGEKPKDADVAALQPKPRSLDWKPGLDRELLAQAKGTDALERLRALTALRRHRKECDAATVKEAVRENWDHADRYVRLAAARLLATLDDADRKDLAGQARTPRQQTTLGLADPEGSLDGALALVAAKDADAETRLAAVRLVQEALGGLMSHTAKGTVWEGYSPRAAPEKERAARAAAALRTAFPSGRADLDREISRTLAVLEDEDAGTLAKVAGRLTTDSDPVEDVHYLTVLARLRAPRTAALTKQTATALLALDRKVTQRRLNRDTNWSPRVAELYAELAHKDGELNAALLAHADFGRPDHALFAKGPGFNRARAAALFLERAEKEEGYAWNPALVELIGELPEARCVPVLRKLWDRGGLQEAILPVLARKPQADDRGKFVEGLNSPQLATVRLCLEALQKLPDGDGAQLLALVRCLRRLPDGKEENTLREEVAAYLRKLTGQEKPGADKEAWTAWLTKAHPELAAKLGGADGVDVAGWAKRLAALDWSAGDAERGRGVFTKASCAACHSGAQALGPDLRGVTGRFSRDDLFTAILQPSRDVSPRYRTTVVTTEDGKVYQGLVIYEAVDSLLLQTGPAATVRVVNKEIAERRLSDVSLMPVGSGDRGPVRVPEGPGGGGQELTPPVWDRIPILSSPWDGFQSCHGLAVGQDSNPVWDKARQDWNPIPRSERSPPWSARYCAAATSLTGTSPRPRTSSRRAWLGASRRKDSSTWPGSARNCGGNLNPRR